MLPDKLVAFVGGFSPENEEVPQNLGTDVLHFKIFLEVPISLEVHLYCAQTAGKTLKVGNPLFLFSMLGGLEEAPHPAWHPSASLDQENVRFLARVLLKPWGLVKNLGYPSLLPVGAQPGGETELETL